MKAAFLVSMVALPQHVWADCSPALLDPVLKVFNVSNIDELPEKVISLIQKQCEGGECIQDFGGACGEQDIDDIECEVPIFDESVKIGTDLICNTACNDWPCKVACDDIDTGICWGSDFLLCKTGCLIGGIFDKHCLEQCEHTIVDPCVEYLVDDCKSGCESAFTTCKNGCDKELSLDINAKFEKLEHLVSSLAVPKLDLDCHGTAVLNPLIIDMNISTSIDSLDTVLKIHTKDVGIGTTTELSLEQLKVGLSLPVNGSIQCGLKKNIDIHIGDTTVDNFDLNFDLNNKAFKDIAAVICLDLPFCKDAIQDAIDGAIRAAIKEFTPPILAKLVTPIVQKVVDKFSTCPKIEPEQPELFLA